MAKVKLMTQAEYAQHRGCSAVAVHKAVKAGRISTIDGKIDPAVADIQWAANTRARVAQKPKSRDTSTAADAGTGPALAEGAQPELPMIEEEHREEPRPGDGQYHASRSSREEAEARRAWLRLLEEEKTLVRVDQVRAELAAKLAPVRQRLLQLPARIASALAAESDPAAVQTLLEAELHQALASLAPSEAAAA